MNSGNPSRCEIVLQYDSAVPVDYLDEFRKSLTTEDFSVTERKIRIGAVASLDWVVPTAITILITKPFLDAFLKRASEDFADFAYMNLKKAVAGLAKKVFVKERLPLKRITSDGITDAPNVSLFSIYVDVSDVMQVKFVFEPAIPEDQYDLCMNELFVLLEGFSRSKDAKDSLSCQIAELPESRRRRIYLTYDLRAESWEVRDPIAEAIDGSRD
jgi:hypothetical protein